MQKPKVPYCWKAPHYLLFLFCTSLLQRRSPNKIYGFGRRNRALGLPRNISGFCSPLFFSFPDRFLCSCRVLCRNKYRIRPALESHLVGARLFYLLHQHFWLGVLALPEHFLFP